jgi:L-seryl-tRNA(Ser) seleniumtransferase
MRSPRELPRVDELLDLVDPDHLVREEAKVEVRAALDRARVRLQRGEAVSAQGLIDEVGERVAAATRPWLQPVINATGVVLHTNLGRAPWAPEALEAAGAAAAGYCNVELDLDEGVRGRRGYGVERHLQALTGAEAAVVVNNCAAAVLLALTALASGREVLVSRGELVEIGGSFRVPDVITACGARLVEVGTTNRTRLRDYEAGLRPETAVLLKVHPSNFRIEGFTEAPALAELAALARRSGVPLVYDLGSGSLDGVEGEPGVRAAVAAGATLVAFSGDKLLGGPQAGIVVGERASIERLKKHPLMRALRVDKVVLAALEATLALHRRGQPTPVDRMLAASSDDLRARGEAMVATLSARGVAATLRPAEGAVGGGSAPGRQLPGWWVCVPHPSPDQAASALRRGRPAALCLVRDDALAFDLRTVRDEQVEVLAQRLAELTPTR